VSLGGLSRPGCYRGRSRRRAEGRLACEGRTGRPCRGRQHRPAVRPAAPAGEGESRQTGRRGEEQSRRPVPGTFTGLRAIRASDGLQRNEESASCGAHRLSRRSRPSNFFSARDDSKTQFDAGLSGRRVRSDLVVSGFLGTEDLTLSARPGQVREALALRARVGILGNGMIRNGEMLYLWQTCVTAAESGCFEGRCRTSSRWHTSIAAGHETEDGFSRLR